MSEALPEYGPPAPPTIPEGVPGELHINAMGDFFLRYEINDHWVSYRTFDEYGDLRRGVAIPRFQIISDEVIRAGDEEDAALEAATA